MEFQGFSQTEGLRQFDCNSLVLCIWSKNLLILAAWRILLLKFFQYQSKNLQIRQVVLEDNPPANRTNGTNLTRCTSLEGNAWKPEFGCLQQHRIRCFGFLGSHVGRPQSCKNFYCHTKAKRNTPGLILSLQRHSFIICDAWCCALKQCTYYQEHKDQLYHSHKQDFLGSVMKRSR